MKKKIFYADDDYESIGTLLKLRTPPLFIGLVLGVVISFVTSRFEAVLARNVHVAFFIPFVVYIADAVGTQTEAIYSRDLRSGRAKFSNYLSKEVILGIIFGLLFGICAAGVIYLWLSDRLLSTAVGTATFFAVASAPLVALLTTQLFQKIKKDPAAGAGPITTVIQDMTSVVIYGLVCSVVIL